uniref:Uncharacterized protein n=1 Tax=Ditylenchus dipsaci TaxID=166011 RepID=A0A915DHY1_9BILA
MSSLTRLAKCGVQSQYMLPSYPAKTYPNLHSIATGLYPGSHGIIDDYMLDKSYGKIKKVDVIDKTQLFPNTEAKTKPVGFFTNIISNVFDFF